MNASRIFLLSLIVIISNANAMDKKDKDLDAFYWPMPSTASTFNGYWPTWELEQDLHAQRLRTLPYEQQGVVLEQVSQLKTMEDQYKAACCVAAQIPDVEVLASFRLQDLLKKAVASDLIPFVATITPYKPDPNKMISEMYSTRRHDFMKNTILCTLQTVPLFFNAKSEAMATWLWTMGVDYTLRGSTDNRTIVHHLCTHPLTRVGSIDTHEMLRLLSFYKSRGVDLNAVDTHGRTALHNISLYLIEQSERELVPLVLFLINQGVDFKAKDVHGKTFCDYLKVNRYMPERVGATSSTVLAYLESDFKRDRYLVLSKSSGRCETHVHQAKVAMKVTKSFIKECLPLVPSQCASISCDELNNGPEYSGARKLLAWDRETECGAKVRALVDKEQKRIFSDYNLARTWLALQVATSIQYLLDSGFEYSIRTAFMEDDYAFIEYVLQHEFFCYVKKNFCLRSLRMAQLVSHYIDLRSLQENGTSLWHHVAEHGALMDQDAIDFLKQLKLDNAAEDAYHEIPAELLVRESYRYKGQIKKLLRLLLFLWPKIEIPSFTTTPRYVSKPTRAVNIYTGISLKDWALDAHKIWNIPETAEVLDLMASYESEARYNGHYDKRFDENPIIARCQLSYLNKEK